MDRHCVGCQPDIEDGYGTCEICSKWYCVNCLYLVCSICHQFYTCFRCGFEIGRQNRQNNQDNKCSQHQNETEVHCEVPNCPCQEPSDTESESE